MQATDAQLVEQTRNGDNSAFGDLVRRYQGLIYGLAYHRLGSFADAQDIAQETFIKAFRSLDQLVEPERFAPWLKTIAANECKMLLRACRPTAPLDEIESMPSHAARSAQDWQRTERHADIRRAVDSLPDRSRLMVTLHYLSGHSHEEIGKFLGVEPNAVAQHLHRARRQLKDILMREIEEGYEMNKLRESFTEQVLGRITLYPIAEGRIMISDGGGDVRGLIMAITDHGAEKSYITLWTREADLNEITLGPLPHRTSENPKGRALDSALDLIKALGAQITRVVLHLVEARRCLARVHLRQCRKDFTLDMRPSDAIALAFRAKAPILAEQSVIDRGNVSEDDITAPDTDMDPIAHSEEFDRLRKHDLIIDKVYAMGISVEDCVDTVRFRKDEARGVLRVWLEAIPGSEITLDLNEYAPGVEMIFDLARRRGPGGRMFDGDPSRGFARRHKHLYSMLGEDARMRVVLEGG